jgi:ribonucleoside-diphosphate reductase alpha chain
MLQIIISLIYKGFKKITLVLYVMNPVVSRFKLDESTRDEIIKKTPMFGFNGLGEVVFRRTYSRNNETWNDVVLRVMEGVMSVRKEHFKRNGLHWEDVEWQPYAREMSLSLFDMEWLPPGRGLWMMGTDFAYERGSAALNNCAAIDTKDDVVHCAEWTMDFLMNGVGVGFSTSWRGEASMPDKEDSVVYVIEDSREGWVQSLILLMCSYIDSPKHGKNKYPKFDYTAIRKEGEPILGFGGTSSGHKPLQKMHERIDEFLTAFCIGKLNKIVDNYVEQKKEDGTSDWIKEQVSVSKDYSHTRLVADIFNAIGACVVAGNVRRSAEICLGDVEDADFINLKNYDLNPERQEIGWMSNNSVVLKADQNYEDFSYIPEMAKRIINNGEPGMINLSNIQKFARYGKEKPDQATLVNPCGEIPLCSAEMCNLAETFPPRCKNPERFYKALEYATFYASTVSILPTHRPETNAIIAKNRRIGISISGIAQWESNKSLVESEWGEMNYTKMTDYLRKGYKVVKTENERLAKLAGVPAAIRVTTIKPSGSISLLAGCTPGVHYPVSRFAIRRVRISKESPLVPALIKAGISYEDDSYSENTYVFSFAIDHGNVRSSTDVSPWEQFSVVAMLQRCYSDNCVSATIYFDKEKDAPDVEKMLAMYIPILKSVSMLPHSGHGYKQAPYEPIDETQYNQLKDSYNRPDFDVIKNNIPMGSKFCSGDLCE